MFWTLYAVFAFVFLTCSYGYIRRSEGWGSRRDALLASVFFTIVIYSWFGAILIATPISFYNRAIVRWENTTTTYDIEYGRLPLYNFNVEGAFIIGTGSFSGETTSSVAVYYIDGNRLRCYESPIEKALIYNYAGTPYIEREVRQGIQRNGKPSYWSSDRRVIWRIYIDLDEILENIKKVEWND